MVIDGNSILNRAFYGVRLLTNHEGLFTNAIYGFLATYFKIQEEEKPDRVIVCFDVKAKTFRHEMYDGYKAKRKGMPEELAMQLPVVKEVLNKLGVICVEKEGFEADDLLGTISKKSNENGYECVLLTGDKDSLQLIGNGTMVKLVISRMGQTTTKNYDRDLFFEEYGFEPNRIIDLKALMGDSSDNIPGVPGVGEKTAMALVQKFGTIDNVYKNIEDESIKNAARNKIKANREMAELSRTLATIDRNVSIDIDIKNLPQTEIDKDGIFNLFTRLEFKNFITKLDLSKSETQKIIEEKLDYERVTSFDDAKTNIESIKEQIAVVISDNCDVFCISSNNKLFVFCKNDFQDQEFKRLLKMVFEGEAKKIMHDAKKNVVSLKDDGIIASNIVFDTCIAAYLLDPTETGHGLSKTALSYLSKHVKDDAYNADDAFNLLGEGEEAVDSIADNCNAVLKLYPVLSQKLKSEGMEELFYNVEMPLMYILADMQIIGIKIDNTTLVKYGEKLSKRLEEIKNNIHEMAGEEFNINSPKKLGEILFDKLGLPVIKKTKTGYSTNIDVLEQLKGYNPIIGQIIEYRQLSKLISTYVDGLLKTINKKDGRIHSHFQQTVTATGRLSSTDPNLQNIPVRTELGAELRNMFVADEDKVLIDADYSQIELRVLAHIANDKHMIETFKMGNDIHTITASQVFHVPVEEVTKNMRSASKAVNFGIVYGISEFSLAGDIGVSRKEAGEYIQRYLETYKGVASYMEDIKEKAKADGYISSLFGRKRYVPEIKSKNFNIRSFGERVALNTPIQATAADIIKIAMINVSQRLKNEKLNARLILQIHDELIIEAPEIEKERVAVLLQEEMENAFKMNVPLIADAGCGKNWSEAKNG